MAKQKKKRNKAYHGADAAIRVPKVTRIVAPDRNKLQQWWVDNKRAVSTRGIMFGLLLLVTLLLTWLVRWIF